MRRDWILAVLLAVPLTFCLSLGPGCHKRPVEGIKHVNVLGTVLDKESREPIDSAWIAFEDTASVLTYTDTLGAFFTGWFPWPQEVSLFAGKGGYITSSKIFRDLDHDTTGVVFELVRAR
ncbi:MAG: hypothetical protein HZB43_08450 [candidate division Zixibacteria bacterium]|nr:hypothetical protein [candidate division Zixibacteria bacterium]